MVGCKVLPEYIFGKVDKTMGTTSKNACLVDYYSSYNNTIIIPIGVVTGSKKVNDTLAQLLNEEYFLDGKEYKWKSEVLKGNESRGKCVNLLDEEVIFLYLSEF